MKRFSAILFLLILTPHSLDASAQGRRRPPRSSGDTRPGPSFHHAGPKLAETELYELYEYHHDNPREECFNSPNSTWATLSLVFKVDANYLIIADDVYKRRVENEILPILKQRCNAVNTIAIHNFIKGVRLIGRDTKEYSYDEPTNDYEWYLNNIRIELNSQGRFTYFKQLGGWNSLADLRKVRREEQETAARKRDAETAREREADRVAKMEYSSDGKLKLTDLTHKNLFQQIYDGDFIGMLSQNSTYDYLPYLMYSGHISVYSKICRSSLSPSKVAIDIYSDRHLRTEYGLFTKTEYYERYLATTVYMEPKYEAAYRLSVPNSLKKIYDSFKEKPIDMGMPAYFIMASSRALPLALDSRQLISNNGCGSPSVITFTDNLTKFVTGQWSAETADGYKYTGWEGQDTVRFYPKVPATFSPKFPVPKTDGSSKIFSVRIYLNESRLDCCEYKNQNPGLKFIEILPFAVGHDQEALGIERWNYSSLPQEIQTAIKEYKYYVAMCQYLEGDRAIEKLYWNANGPLPSAAVQDFVKDIIGKPRSQCPVNPER